MKKEEFEKVQREDGMKEEFIQSLWAKRPVQRVELLDFDVGSRAIREVNADLRLDPRFAHHYEDVGQDGRVPSDVVEQIESLEEYPAEQVKPGSYAGVGDATPIFEEYPAPPAFGISVERFHEILHAFGYSERNAERLWGVCGEGLKRFPSDVVESQLAVVAENFASRYALIDLIESDVGRINASEKVI